MNNMDKRKKFVHKYSFSYEETSIKTIIDTLNEWCRIWEKKDLSLVPPFGCVCLSTTLLAFNDGANDFFPEEAKGLWVYLDSDVVCHFFDTKDHATAYIKSKGKKTDGKIEPCLDKYFKINIKESNKETPMKADTYYESDGTEDGSVEYVKCPECKQEIWNDGSCYDKPNYCPNCGQPLDWGGKKK